MSGFFSFRTEGKSPMPAPEAPIAIDISTSRSPLCDTSRELCIAPNVFSDVILGGGTSVYTPDERIATTVAKSDDLMDSSP